MSQTRPLAYYTGATTLPDTTKIDNISIGDPEANVDWSSKPGDVTWWMGPDEDAGGYIIGTTNPEEDGPTPPGVIPPDTGSVTFWRTKGYTDQDWFDLFLVLSRQTGINNIPDAIIWLNDNSFWTSFVPGPTSTLSPTPTQTPTQTTTQTPTQTATNTPTPSITATITPT